MTLEAIHCESAVFLGNSMPIRDADMYACNFNWKERTQDEVIFSSELTCHFIQVTANRGASGIDGLLSTAVGFAVGCNKRVSGLNFDPNKNIWLLIIHWNLIKNHVALTKNIV